MDSGNCHPCEVTLSCHYLFYFILFEALFGHAIFCFIWTKMIMMEVDQKWSSYFIPAVFPNNCFHVSQVVYKREQSSNQEFNLSPNWLTTVHSEQSTTSELLLRRIIETISANPTRPRTCYSHRDSKQVTQLHHRGSILMKPYKPC